MALTYSKTLEDLRKAIGRNLGKMVTGTTSGSGSTTTAVDATLFGGDDEYNGSYIRITSGTYDGTTRRITDYTSSTGTMTFAAVAGTIAGSVTYELWESGFDPDVVDEFIDQAILELAGRSYDPIENLDIHTDGINARWEIPSNIEMIQDVYYRDKFTVKELHNCDTVFTATNNASDTIVPSVVTEDKKRGSGANKFVLTSASADTGLMTVAIDSVDLSKYDYIEFWIKSTQTTTAAGDLRILLDDNAACASPIETLNVPVLTRNVWKYCRLPLNLAEKDTAIISIGLKFHDVSNINDGDATIFLDDIKAVKNDTATWVKLPRDTWRIDKEGTLQGASTADLVLSDRGRALASYRMIKLVGGDKPALFSGNDSNTTEVMERFVIAYATALTAQAGSTRAELDTDGMRTLAGFWHNKAAEARNSLPFLTNVRTVR